MIRLLQNVCYNMLSNYDHISSVKIALEQAMNPEKGCNSTAPLFLQPRRYMWVGIQR